MAFDKTKAIKVAFICVVVLMACVLAISMLKRSITTVAPNTSSDVAKLQTDTIYGDIIIKTNDDAFSHDAIEDSSCNNAVAEYLQRNVKKGDTIIHVSHGVGVQTLLMAKLVKKSGRIYVYNPCKKYVDAIIESAKANGFDSRIFANTLGMSDRSFSGVLVHKNNMPIIDGYIETANYAIPTGYSAVTIDVSSIDEQLPNVQNVNILRINMRSDCSKILRGAKQVISKSPDIVIICDFDVSYYKELTIFDDFMHQGFHIYVLHKDGSYMKEVTLKELGELHDSHILVRK